MQDELLETLSSLEHEQWCDWSSAISQDIRDLLDICRENSIENDTVKKLEDKLNRWSKLWIAYDKLSEEMKDLDRDYALKVVDELKSRDLI